MLGFGDQFLITRASPALDGRSGIVLAAVGALAVLVILAHSMRRYGGLRGSAIRAPAYFGACWLVALLLTVAATFLIAARFPRLDPLSVAYPGSSVLIGVIYALAGVSLRARREFLLGCWMIAVGGASSMLAMPLMALSIGVLAAVGFTVCALLPTPTPGCAPRNDGR